jgi:DNA-binding winged helix-turn-helix (wHTH) protein/tetratricopeptide (TPR) repeat protein
MRVARGGPRRERNRGRVLAFRPQLPARYTPRAMPRTEVRLGPFRSDFLLADWLVRPTQDRLSGRGREVHLRPKLMDLLVALARRPGQVVSREELLDELWPQQFIGESALTRAIADLRQALADDSHEPGAIETIPKRGYRLLLPVSTPPAGPETAPCAPATSATWPFTAPLPVETPDRAFVGRATELATLEAALDRAIRGHGRVAFVTGESGTGKSALIGEFATRAAHRPHACVVATARGQTISGPGEPFLLFRQLAMTLTGDIEPRLAAGAMTAQQAEALWTLLPTTADLLLEVAPDLIETLVLRGALSARVEDRTRDAPAWYDAWRARLDRLPPPAAGSPPALASQCVDWLRALARAMPLVLVFDDLHWADAGSLDLLFHLASDLDGVPLLAVVAYRPAEIVPGADGSPHRAASVLRELRRRHGDVSVALRETTDLAFVAALVDREPNLLGANFRERLFNRTGGHPLFTTELLRTMQDRGALERAQDGRWVEGGALDWDAMPARMEAALEARIARVPQDLRRVLDVASVEGEEFTAEVVARVLALDESRVVLALGSDLDRGYALVTAAAIAVDPIDGQRVSTYRFRHAAIQQYLVAQLDVVERPHLHAAVGTALEQVLPAGRVTDVATRLAFHFEQGGLLGKAVECLLQAAEQATALAAEPEGLMHLRRAEALVERVPEEPRRDVLELAVRMGRVMILSQTSQGDPGEIVREFQRATLLASRAPDDTRVCMALVRLTLLNGLQGNYLTALRTAADGHARAQRLGAVSLAAAARAVGGVFRLRSGDLTGARADLEAAALPLTTIRTSDVSVGGLHPEIWRLTGLGYALFFLGYPDQALARMRDAISAAERDGTPASLVYAMGLNASIHDHRREPDEAEDMIHSLLQLLRGRVYSRSDVLSGFILGWASAQRGDLPRGIELMSEAVRAVRQGTLKVDWTKFLARLGEAQCRAGRAAEALATLDEGLAAAHSTDERYYEAELLRLRGEALETLGEPGAESCYRQAIDLARVQCARTWELRASTSLARTWQRVGRAADARDLLTAIFAWFSEGQATRDLLDAATLLHALEARPT